MQNQIKLSLEELATLAIERLISKGKLDSGLTDIDWHFNNWKLSSSYAILSQED